MRKRIIITAAIVIVLAGVYFALTKWDIQKEGNGDSSLTNEPIPIFKTEKDNITSMTISTPDYEYTFSKSDDKWRVRGNEQIKLNNTKIENLAYDFASINADEVIENISDTTIYGFDSPAGTPYIILADGSEVGFVVGGKTPTGSGYYFKMTDSDAVYTVYSSKAESFIASLDVYREKMLAEINAAELTEIRIKRSDADIVIQAKSEEDYSEDSMGLNTWKMITPYSRDVSGYYFEEHIIKKITDFQISKFIDDNPTSYTRYGLSSPAYLISLTQKDKPPVVFLIGNTADDEFYVKLKNEDAVYTIKQSAFEYKDIDPLLLIDTLVYIQNIDAVDTITLHTANDAYTLKITREGENTSYLVNDVPADESAFKKIYQQVIGLTIRGRVSEAAEGTPLFRLEFKFNDGRAGDVVEAIPYQDRYAAIQVNGTAEYYVMKDQISTLIEKVRQFAENPAKQ